jgi:hypothetical protein
MKGKWYAALAISMVLLIISGLVACVPTTTSAPANSKPDEGGGPSPSASSPHESGGAGAPANLELYYCGDFVVSNRFMTLQTIYSKAGNGSVWDYITVNQSPWVMNYQSKQTSDIGYEFYFDIWQGNERPRINEIMPSSGFGFRNTDRGPLYDVYNLIFYDTGKFTIDIKASGCEWWIKVGIEPNTGALNANQKMIIGKWQHGISECPPHLARKACDDYKKLPENKLYYLEFFDDGQVAFIASSRSLSGGFTHFDEGRYSVIGDKLDINWIVKGYEAYEIKKLSENEMVLLDKTGVEQPFHRVD